MERSPRTCITAAIDCSGLIHLIAAKQSPVLLLQFAAPTLPALP
jgi:hypothetical protein